MTRLGRLRLLMTILLRLITSLGFLLLNPISLGRLRLLMTILLRLMTSRLLM